MRIHFIAIGGAIMHNLAICLKNLGHNVSGSDDIIFDPAKKNLEETNPFHLSIEVKEAIIPQTQKRK